MRIRSLTLLLTLQCPARCEHCATESHPQRREQLDAELARRAVREAAALGLPLVFSGGEPLLRLRLLLDLAGRARTDSQQMSIAVSTNGFWARTPARAERILRRLKQSGVDTLLMSTDRYHLPFVPLSSVLHAARSAVALGLRCEIAVPAVAEDAVASDLLRALREVPGVRVKTHPLSRTGRAVQLGPPVFAQGVQDRPCGVLGELALLPDGFLYGCCAASIHFGRQSVLCAGHYDEAGLSGAITKLTEIPLLTDIQNHGPLRSALAEAERSPRFSLRLLSSYTDLCAQCESLCRAYDQTRPTAQSPNPSTPALRDRRERL